MEQTRLMMIAQLMSQQSGEEVDVKNIVKLPEPDSGVPETMRNDRYDVYAARTTTYTCLVHWCLDGRIHVYVHPLKKGPC